MHNEITTATVLLREMLLERGINDFPRVSRAHKHERYTETGRLSETWIDIEFESIPVDYETFTHACYTTKHSAEEYVSDEFMNEQCDTVRFSCRTYHYLDDEDRDTLRAIGKIQTIQEANEYETLVC